MNQFSKILLSYPQSLLAYFFGLCIVVFSQPLQFVGHRIFGNAAQKKIVDICSLGMLWVLKILGTRVIFKNPYRIPENAPLIIVANHQSFYDIPPLVWFFRKNSPKFIGKKELGKGYFGISYHLNHGGSALIDRKNTSEAAKIIINFSKKIATEKCAAVIFPEGTRTKDGKVKKFATTGLQLLFRHIPKAYIVPVTIKGSYDIFKNGAFPVQTFGKFEIIAHAPIKLEEQNPNTIIPMLEATIKKGLL